MPSQSTRESLDPRSAGAMRFKDKVCIVTGAGQGIGRAAARRLGAEGGKIVVAERSQESALETTRQLVQAGVEAMASFADVSSFEEAERLVAFAVDHYGRLDVMVNVVGGTIWWQPFHLYTQEQILLELERWHCHVDEVLQSGGSCINASDA